MAGGRIEAAKTALVAAVSVGGSTDLSAGYFRGLQEANRVAGRAARPCC